MRERAEAAQPATDGPSWIVDRGNRWANDNEVFSGPESPRSHDVATATDGATAEHIASWHPAVALAVADSFDAAAAVIEGAGSGPLAMAMRAIAEPQIKAARAYLTTP